MSRYVVSKWKKTLAIMKHGTLEEYVPETSRMTKSSLLDYLNRYHMVYIKPDNGCYGNGVMRVERISSGYAYQLGTKLRSFSTFDSMYTSIVLHTKGKKYLVQKGIHLLKYKDKRFDLRVMAQYSPEGEWVTTGIIGRTAGEGKIVTNYHSGGKIVMAEHLLLDHSDRVQGNLQLLSKLGAEAGKAMQKAFPGVYVIGLDVAVDKSLHPWILEVNTRPDPYIFRKHSDPKVFRRIMRYAKAYPK